MLEFRPIWFDSMGAKSACTLVRTPDVTVLIDPGCAAMQPGFPASERQKKLLRTLARKAILAAMREADLIVISHYHHDHFLPEDVEALQGKKVWIKNPNAYINESQRERAERFWKRLVDWFGDGTMRPFGVNAARAFADPFENLELARTQDFGDYNRRRRELLNKGKQWFWKMTEWWQQLSWLPEMDLGGVEIRFAEGKQICMGETRIRFTGPLFHGVDYSRLGWVFATVVEHGGRKLIHSSDINGPVIEDYAEWIVREDPDVLILDGPMTYMYGYLVTRTTLQRTIRNALRILEKTHTEWIIYDHHLPREPRFRERTAAVWHRAAELNRRLVTAAEYLGKPPKVQECYRKLQNRTEGRK